jgi:hypothetical protein
MNVLYQLATVLTITIKFNSTMVLLNSQRNSPTHTASVIDDRTSAASLTVVLYRRQRDTYLNGLFVRMVWTVAKLLRFVRAKADLK